MVYYFFLFFLSKLNAEEKGKSQNNEMSAYKEIKWWIKGRTLP